MGTPHTFHKCDCGECYFCRSELPICDVCGGFEGTLTTECCGRRLTSEEETRIYNKANLDFRDGQWVDLPNYTRVHSGQGEDTKFLCRDGNIRTVSEVEEWKDKLNDMKSNDEPSIQHRYLLFNFWSDAEPGVRRSLRKIYRVAEVHGDVDPRREFLRQFILEQGYGLYHITEGDVLGNGEKQETCHQAVVYSSSTPFVPPSGSWVGRTFYDCVILTEVGRSIQKEIEEKIVDHIYLQQTMREEGSVE